MITSSLDAPSVTPTDAVDAAFQMLSDWIELQHGGDETYFRNQLPRYTRTMRRLRELRPPPCRVLDIGSHYLHQSVLLSELGYEVTGIDIALFSKASFVTERASKFGIRNMEVNGLEAGDFLQEQEGKFDLIVFTEILEHITFNPIRLWSRVYELLAPAGFVYLSTPNALRPAAWARQMRDLLAFRGIGTSLDDIMGNVTYGHHWKEYSSRELHRYFAMLSSDFSVTTDWYSSDLGRDPSLTSRVKALLAFVPCFRSDIEAVIRRPGSTGISARTPQLRMHDQASDAAAGAHEVTGGAG